MHRYYKPLYWLGYFRFWLWKQYRFWRYPGYRDVLRWSKYDLTDKEIIELLKTGWKETDNV